MFIVYIILGILVLIIFWMIAVYNSLIVLLNRKKEAWSDINVQLKIRYDLIPNLVSTVKGYASHERELLEKVTQARAQALGAQTVEEHAKAENALSSTLKSLFAVTENYPDLKAAGNFLELQRELRDTEDKIQASRRFYNGNVRDINIKIERFPDRIIAGLFNFKKQDLFELEEEEAKKPVKVDF
ncbi:MAG: LemA family protein [Candidatus Nealsonbacteria bacterium]